MKNLLAITVAGQLKWLEEAISTLRDDLDVLVIDDGTPGDSIWKFCKQKKIQFVGKLKPMGLTNSWNLAYQYFKENNYDNCIISNDDVRFPAGFSEGLFEGLKEFDVVAPLSNEPGNIFDDIHSPACQDVRRYTDIEPTAKGNINKVQQVLSVRYRNGAYRQSNFFNGFCFAFSRSIAKFVYNEQFLFNPVRINVGNEYDLADRVNERSGKTGICKTSYVFHWKGKTTEKLDKYGVSSGDYREQLWK